MYGKFSIAFIVFLSTIGLNAQTDDMTRILREIEQNNRDLKAYSAWIESREFEMQSENNLRDPEVGAYFLPFGNHGSGNYSEFQISQSFEFPRAWL